VTALLLAAVAAGIYLLVVWVPVWVIHYEVRQVVRDHGNQAVKNPDDAELKERMLAKLRSLDSVTVVGEDGRAQRVPTVDVRPQELVWEREDRGAFPTLHVAFEYPREVHYPFVDRWQEVTMRVDLTMDISRPDWGPAR
jgi:hypothetical protein